MNANYKPYQKYPQGGIAILTLLGVSVFALAVMITVVNLAHDQAQIVNAQEASQKTFYAAEAGLNKTLYKLASNPSTSSFTINSDGMSTLVTITPDFLPTATEFQGTINVRTTDSTGKVRTIQTRATTSSLGGIFVYGAQTDAGGIEFTSSPSIIKGDIYSNGDINGNGIITGNVTVGSDSILDQQDIKQDSEFKFGLAAPFTDIAQSFVAGTTGTINRFALLLKRVGPNPPLLKWQIVADNNGKPATTYLKFGTIDSANNVDTSLGWVNINVSNSPNPMPTLTAGVRYWLVLDTATTTSGDYWVWGMDSSNTYSNGDGYYTASWTNSNAIWMSVKTGGGDLGFKTWLGSAYHVLSNVTVIGNASAHHISSLYGTAKICGDANYFTISPTALNFLNNPTGPPSGPCPTPLTPGAGVLIDNLPVKKRLPIIEDDITKWKKQIEDASGTIPSCITKTGNTYKVESNCSLGWQKIDGDLEIKKNNTTLTLMGNVWVTGIITIDNNPTIKIASTLSTKSLILLGRRITIGNNAALSGSDCTGSCPTNFLLVVATDTDTSKPCTSTTPSINAANNSASVIFAAPLGSIQTKKAKINAGASYGLCLDNQAEVNFVSSISSLFIPSPTQQPISVVPNTWTEQ